MKSQKSSAEIQTEDVLKHLDIMISKQNVRIKDAQYMSLIVTKVLYKCTELRLSREKWRKRAEDAETKLKNG